MDGRIGYQNEAGSCRLDSASWKTTHGPTHHLQGQRTHTHLLMNKKKTNTTRGKYVCSPSTPPQKKKKKKVPPRDYDYSSIGVRFPGMHKQCTMRHPLRSMMKYVQLHNPSTLTHTLHSQQTLTMHVRDTIFTD